MRPLGIGVTIAGLLAGPPLYALVQAGSITGSTALARGLIVTGVCTVGVSFLAGIIRDYEREAKKKKDGEIVHHPADHAPASGTAKPGAHPTIPGQTIPARPSSTPTSP